MSFPLEHLQHAISDHESADDVRRRANDRDETEDRADRVVLRAGSDDRTDQRDARDRIGRRHQWRVQQRRHARDHLVAEKRRERENVKRGD